MSKAKRINENNWEKFKGQTVTAQHVDGEQIFVGELVSLNSKGWNIRTEDGLVSRSVNSIADISTGAPEGIEDVADDLLETDDEYLERREEEEGLEDLEAEESDDEADDDLEEVDEDSDGVDEVAEEGMTTDQLADIFQTSARALRIRLRKMKLGVGKGRRYHLTDEQIAAVKESFAKVNA